jgi:hypothetical protein
MRPASGYQRPQQHRQGLNQGAALSALILRLADNCPKR